MKRYSLRQAARILAVDRSTLRRWLRTIELRAPRSAGDRRRRTLDQDELAMLAMKHGKVLINPLQVHEVSNVECIRRLEQQCAVLLQRIEVLESQK